MTIKPIVMRCSNMAGCHVQGGIPPDLSDYGRLQAKYKDPPGDTNILVTKGTMTGNVHSSMPWLTIPEQDTIANWIDAFE